MTIRIHTHIELQQNDTHVLVHEKEYIVKFFDKNSLIEDELGEVILDETGEVNLEIDSKTQGKNPLFHDSYPDVYFKLFRKNEQIYQSDVYKNIHWKINKKNDGKAVFVYVLGNVLMQIG